MADRIKGITIEIEGNTTKLSKSLSSVNGDLAKTQSALKDIDKLLKFDPKNIDLLKQKQELLTRAIEDTKEKLDKEKAALDQLKNSDAPEKNKDQMQALERQIAADEQALKDYQAQSRTTAEAVKGDTESQETGFKNVGDTISAVRQGLETVGQDLKNAGQKITTNVSEPLQKVGKAAIGAWQEIDAGRDTIVKATGASGEALEGMAGIMESIATTIPTDFETAAAAIGEVNTRFGATGGELEDLATQFVEFAKINNTDVVSSVDNVQKVIAMFGLETQDAGALLDALTAASQASGVSVDTLAQGLQENATAFDQMGFSASDSIKFLADLDKSGADSSATMTGLRKALQNAAKQGKPMDKALAEIESSIKDATTEEEAMQAAMELFGNKAGPAIAKAVMDGSLSFEALGTSIYDNLGTVEDTFTNTLDPMATMQTTMNELKSAGAELGGLLMETLAPVIQTVAEKIRAVKEWWDQLDPGVQDAIAKIGIVAAVAGPLITMAGSLAMGLSALISPVGLVVAAIAAAIAIGVALYQNWDEIKAKCEELGKQIKEKWETMKKNVSDAVNRMKENATARWNEIKSSVSQTAENLKSAVTTAMDNLKTNVSTAWENTKQAAATAWEGIKKAISDPIGTAQGIVESVAKFIEDKLGFAGLTDKVHNIFETIKKFVKDPIETAKEVVTTAAAWIEEKLGFSGLVDKVQAIFNTIQRLISDPLGTVKDVVTSVTSWIEEKLGFSGLTDTVNAVFTAIQGFIDNPLEAAQKVVTSVAEAIENALGFTGLSSTVQNLFISLKNFMTNPVEEAKRVISGVIEDIKGFFNNLTLKLPKIELPPLPKFKFVGEWNFKIGQMSAPHLEVVWNARAMNNPIMLDGATIFGAMGGHLLGGGEAGREIIVGQQSLIEMFRASVAQRDAVIMAQNAQVIRLLQTQAEQGGRPIILNSRELTRGLRSMGVSFNG